MFAPSRQEVRQFYFDTWTKFQQGMLLSDLEKITVAILQQHPEYHDLFLNPELQLEQDWPPELGQTNPFLHMSLHMAIEEQRSIDQPFGIRSLYNQLTLRMGNEHDAQHAIMDCLGEMIWQAQRSGTPPDINLYITLIRKKLDMGEEENARFNPLTEEYTPPAEN